MLVSWEIWKERNARVFRSSATPTAVVVRNIKEEVRLWVMAGAKNLGVVMPRERWTFFTLSRDPCFKPSSLLMEMASLLSCFYKMDPDRVKCLICAYHVRI